MFFIGPGRKRAKAETISSKVVGLNFCKNFFIPSDSNWKIPTVFTVVKIFRASESSSGMVSNSKSSISFKMLVIKVRFFKPKKSIFNKPNSSR